MATTMIETSAGKRGTGRNQFSKAAWDTTPYSLKYIQAKTMLDEGKTYDQIQALTGLAPATISKVKKGIIELSPSWIKPVKSAESVKLTLLIHQILDSITPEIISQASFMQRATGAAILIDKRRLLDGESTANVSHAGFIDVLQADRAELMRRLNSLDVQ